ncbi:MAG: oligosaccharide flippase family protein [Thermoplasmata archaeon]
MAEESSGARDGLHSVTRGTLILLLGTLGFVGANFIARVLLVRNLTEGQFSEFYIALTLAGLLTALGQLGLPSAVARSIPFAATDPDRRSIVRTGFLVTIPLAVGAGGVLFLLSFPISNQYHSPVLGLTLQFFAVAVAASIVASQIAAVFQGFEEVRANAVFIQILNPILFILFLLLLITPGPAHRPLGYQGALLAYVLANVLSLVGIFAYYDRRIRRHLPRGPLNPAAGRHLIRFALPLFVVGILTFLSGSVDTLLLGFFHNAEAGEYGAALSLARLLLVGLGALGYILLPVISRFVRLQDPPAVRVIYATATKWMILTSLPLFLVFVFFPGPSLAFVYRASYAVTPRPLQILLVGAFASTLIGPASIALVAYGETRLLLYNGLAGALVDIGLALLLVPGLGSTGAAIAWTAASAVVPVLSVIELAWFQGVHPFVPHYVVPLLAVGIPVGALFTLLPFTPPSWGLPLLVLGVAGAFLVVVIVTRSIDRGDRLLLDAVERLLGRRVPGVRFLARHFPPRD